MRLFIGNLPYRSTETDLQAWFAEAGINASEISVIRDRLSGESRGFGFVNVTSDDEAQQAIQSCNGKVLMGRTIIVNEARPNPADSARNRESGSGAARSFSAGRAEW
ncbi:MAG: RNA-binding protein [Bryobacterales bacterium]|nr:RNA-binding protein [Bryobacterales bacterium]